MRAVSFLAVSLCLLAYSAISRADGDAQAPSKSGRTPDSSLEHIDEGADLATTIGLGNDVHFAQPRNFRTEGFNGDHVEVEPLAADPPESNSSER